MKGGPCVPRTMGELESRPHQVFGPEAAYQVAFGGLSMSACPRK